MLWGEGACGEGEGVHTCSGGYKDDVGGVVQC